ncbi:MAG: hypothetical protein HKN63_08170 [Rhodobacteraceae bacterium]|nr:hypothetical protein [Paracoccaceae bacterium]
MSETRTAPLGLFDAWEADTARPSSSPKPSWPLMGDIVASRGGVPEHLIQWRRTQGEDDPAPQLDPGKSREKRR